MYQITTVAHIDPAKHDDVIAAAEVAAESTRKQEGNLFYNFYSPVGDKSTIIIVEAWEKEENFEGHKKAAENPEDGVAKFAKVFDPTFTAPPESYEGETLV